MATVTLSSTGWASGLAEAAGAEILALTPGTPVAVLNSWHNGDTFISGVSTAGASFLVAILMGNSGQGGGGSQTPMKVNSVTGGSLTWVKLAGGTCPLGTVAIEFWGAVSTGALSNVTITGTFAYAGALDMSLVSLSGVKLSSPVGLTPGPLQGGQNASIDFVNPAPDSMLLGAAMSSTNDLSTITAGTGTTLISNDWASQSFRSSSAVPSSTAPSSILFGTTLYGTDNATVAVSPGLSSLLISAWNRPLDPGPAPWSRGNFEFIRLIATNSWRLRCLTANGSSTDGVTAVYQPNVMLEGWKTGLIDYAWASDYTYSLFNGESASACNDWSWVAWQVIVGADSFTFRQWIRIGRYGTLKAKNESIVTFADARAALVANAGWSTADANAWTPASVVDTIQVGIDKGNVAHVKVRALSSDPTTTDLNTWAEQGAAESGIWADWELSFVSGSPVLTDRSGSGHNLTNNGTLYAGATGPDLSAASSGPGVFDPSVFDPNVFDTTIQTYTASLSESVGLADSMGSAQAVSSVIVDTTQWGNDWLSRTLNLDATQGVLASCWYKAPDPGATPWSISGNTPLCIIASNWSLRCGCGTASYDGSSTHYRASVQIIGPSGAWIGEYATLDTTNTRTATEVKDWQGVLYQVVMDATSFTIRMWVRFGVGCFLMGPYSSTVTFTACRTGLVNNAGWTQAAADAWVPSTTVTQIYVANTA